MPTWTVQTEGYAYEKSKYKWRQAQSTDFLDITLEDARAAVCMCLPGVLFTQKKNVVIDKIVYHNIINIICFLISMFGNRLLILIASSANI